jgi:hypothetical protein
MELQETGNRMNDELSSLVAKAMVSAVVAMALIVMATVLAFHSGGTIV